MRPYKGARLFNSNKRAWLKLEKAFDKALLELDEHEPDSDEYGEILDRVNKLQKMLEDTKPDTLSLDTAAVVAANILGILMIIHHERVNIITSKALPFVAKPR